jgi:hypothetical protein
MVNPETGEVELTIAGQTYRLALKTKGLMALQQHFSVGDRIGDLDEIFDRANKGSIEHIVAFLWAALRRYHPEVTFDGTADLVDAAGGVLGLGRLFGELQAASAPDPRDVEELAPPPGETANPPTAQARRRRGTGAGSISAPDASV